MNKTKSLNSDNIFRNRLQMSKDTTPDWTEKDRQLYREYKDAVKRGEVTYEWIE